MPSPSQVKDFPSDLPSSGWKETTTILELVNGDKQMEKQVIELSKSEDDPPLIFGWDDPVLVQFWDKAVAHSAAGLPLPPPQICGGNHPVGAASAESIKLLKRDLLVYLVSLTPGPQLIGANGGAVGLACTHLQCVMAAARLAKMQYDHPWFHAVLATGPPLTGALGFIYMPRPRDAMGRCDQVSINCTL